MAAGRMYLCDLVKEMEKVYTETLWIFYRYIKVYSTLRSERTFPGRLVDLIVVKVD
jgi:hypothetical protein